MAATRGLRMYETLTLIRRSSSSRLTPSPPAAAAALLPPPPPTNWSRVIAARPYCTTSSSSQLEKRDDEDIHVEEEDVLDDASPSPSSSCSMVNLEKAIHNIMVKGCAPDWLPFKPGSSYWTPPVSQHLHRNVIKLLATFALSNSDSDSDEEALSLSTSRGWPSSSYFIQGTSSPHPVPSEVKVEAMVNKNSENTPQTNDEEG